LWDVVCCPDKGFWGFVVAVDVFSDGHDELLQVVEDATPKLIAGQVAEEALHRVQPESRGRCKSHMKALVLLQPALYVFVFVRSIVIADQVDLFVGRYCLYWELAKKLFWMLNLDHKGLGSNSLALLLCLELFSSLTK
jgi:hypothetical protein